MSNNSFLCVQVWYIRNDEYVDTWDPKLGISLRTPLLTHVPNQWVPMEQLQGRFIRPEKIMLSQPTIAKNITFIGPTHVHVQAKNIWPWKQFLGYRIFWNLLQNPWTLHQAFTKHFYWIDSLHFLMISIKQQAEQHVNFMWSVENYVKNAEGSLEQMRLQFSHGWQCLCTTVCTDLLVDHLLNKHAIWSIWHIGLLVDNI